MTIATLSKSAGIPLRYANRHGLITGQTGTGKTVSLMRLAESFSSQGVPVFIADVKGDIAALSRSCPSTFYDVFGERGTHLKTTISAMGADMLARALELTDTQAGTLEIAFAYAELIGMPLCTIDGLRAVIGRMMAERERVSRQFGQVSNSSASVIMRALLRLESQGGNLFFGYPAFDVAALLKQSTRDEIWDRRDGETCYFEVADKGHVSILKADRLIESPRVYGAFLLWLLSDLYARLPEVGDIDKPRLVFFFDEAHLLFSDANPALLRKVEQIVRLIRSKGVGVYFVSQSAQDVPAVVREQLAHTIAHDRALPVGTARFATMTAQGKPAAPINVSVALPACELGALQPDELPVAPIAVKPSSAITRLEIMLLLIIGVALIVSGYGVTWLWGSGYFKPVAWFVGGLLFLGLVKR